MEVEATLGRSVWGDRGTPGTSQTPTDKHCDTQKTA
ncbi:hypothetical protein DPEC_G00349550 [Dallia pectoralis]|uniref:Uncharacterized protein n=1 Tax=Dallia pectoralis TaxID=75939 RepID=A0ACC2F1K0_DALPE|nr:hypothetical protein DPEC_G00349550 [Dallia pectoralis]